MAKRELTVPDIGGYTDVAIIDVYISQGDEVKDGDSLIALESAKAVTDIPSELSGTIVEVFVEVGDTVSQGSKIASIEVAEEKQTVEIEPEAPKEKESSQQSAPPASEQVLASQPYAAVYHATPSVRQYAREQNVELSKAVGTGPHGRITREDIDTALGSKSPSERIPAPHRSESEEEPREVRRDLSRIAKVSGPHLSESYRNLVHVTHFDTSDITELEEFRLKVKPEFASEGLGLSILPFIIKASVAALKRYPTFNAQLDEKAGQIIEKHYYNIGVAVDTPEGLVVPVIKNADTLTVTQIAQRLAELSEKARQGKLKMDEISGGTFSISSLGGIGGTGFTPIINAPESAILGVSKAQMQPVYDGQTFVPRLILPFSVSYDHRIIDGALGARFARHLAELLEDVRRLLL